MTELFQNVKTYRLKRNSIDLNNNNNVGEDNFWIKITKQFNELAKIQLVSRVFYDVGTDNVLSIQGFDLFKNINNPLIGLSDPWTKNPADSKLTDLLNDNILILDFQDDSLDKRNFYLEGDETEFPELKYLIVRLLTSEEIKKEEIRTGVNQGDYYNYIFSGEIVGPLVFTDFNTNYCLKKTIIYKSNPGIIGAIVNNTIENDTLNLYHPLNWCSLGNTDINDYSDLQLRVKIEPIYSLNSQTTDNKIESVLSKILDTYVPPNNSSHYTEQKYELNDVFWCSLNSPRHLQLILASSENAQEIVDNEIPNKDYLGINNEGSFRYIQNYIYPNIFQKIPIGPAWANTVMPKYPEGNTGGGYRKTPGTLELIRETYMPYYTNNGQNVNTNQNYDTNTKYYGFSYSTSPNFWEMRNEKANYYEIRYKPLIPVKDYILNPGGQDKSLKISFTFGENLQSKTTFERYTSMQGVPTPAGITHYDAVRSQESIEIEFSGYNNVEKILVIFDVASGYSINPATITTTSNIYNISKQNQTNFDIKSYVFSLKISEPINNLDYKFYNTAIKNFTETNTSDMVKNNRRFNLTFVPNDSSTNYNIFTYDDSIRGVTFRNNPLDERKIINQDTPLNLILELEKIDLQDYNSINDSFENATNLSSSVNNVNIINEQVIYLFNNKFSNSSGIEISNPIISIDLSNDTIDNIALTKGLINNVLEKSNVATRTIPELKEVNSTELKFFMFLIKQNFLSDYWKFKDNLSDLSHSTSGNILHQKMLEYDYQRRVAASVHLIDIALSGQIFLINTAKNKTDVSYIKTLDSEILDGTQLIGNPTLNFNNVSNIYPIIDVQNPIYLNLQNNLLGSQSIFIGQNNKPYPGIFLSTYLKSGTTEINQPLYVNNNTFDINLIFSNTNDNADKTISTETNPTQYNGIYYYDVSIGQSSNEKLVNYNVFPGKILVNLVEMPDITNKDTTIGLSSDNREITLTWPKYYYDSSQGEITWTIVRKDMASFKEVTRTYNINSPEISYVNDNVIFIDREIRRFDKYRYTVSGVFNFSSFITVNGVPKNYNLSLNIEPFTLNDIFVCFGYTKRFPFGRFNTTTTNLKLFVPKLLRTDINPTTKELFRNQLLLTNPVPPGVTEEYHLENNITAWPGGRGACTNANGEQETFGRTLTQTSENIYANTSNNLSRKQIYNLLSKSRFRPDR